MAHQRGIKVIVYASTGYIQRTDPDFRPEWSGPGRVHGGLVARRAPRVDQHPQLPPLGPADGNVNRRNIDLPAVGSELTDVF